MLLTVWRFFFSAAPLKHLSFESAWVCASVYTHMHAAWTEGQSAPTCCTSTEQKKKTNSSYFRNPFNTSYKWPDSPLRHCYILHYIYIYIFHCPPSVSTHTQTHTLIAHCQERGVDYYFLALRGQRVDPFPRIPWWPMCSLSVGQRPDGLLMVFLSDTQGSLASATGCLLRNLNLSWICKHTLRRTHSYQPAISSKWQEWITRGTFPQPAISSTHTEQVRLLGISIIPHDMNA